ncbi:class I SAM-dependent methyltransferase [Novosphingobium sp.]|uniref:class I SAM-dependent methyltransferase n=1 Tax=Novosphingobium sp. TaxID=1874826 RepID=UPI001EBA6814|nr:class I SAM-dependent methyltransferase [Novosphingobium sp.]MBK6801071.1 class I SAM-dependent methyltransferase [Novosphingobium sp.]MBK9011630.1 class I SAM-dependent methyltransferase [Novosphingobium sp.]
MIVRTAVLAFALAALAACSKQDPDSDRPITSREFPRADRPVAQISSNEFSSEDQRDNLGEAQVVMDLAQIREGTSVADIGAGEGYYTVRLAERVGARGRVLAQDIDAGAIQRLGQRVERERLDNVSIKTGAPDDPRLPQGSFDRIFLVHMYHEVGEPYAFLWRLRPALKAGGQVIVVDADRPTDQHGMPPQLLFCEFAAVGFRLAEFVRRPELNGYYAQFEAVGPRPAPDKIKPCKSASGKTGMQ